MSFFIDITSKIYYDFVKWLVRILSVHSDHQAKSIRNYCFFFCLQVLIIVRMFKSAKLSIFVNLRIFEAKNPDKLQK